ncbi:MAG: serine/threonine-protein kinase [Planctomycetota bacterium]
MEAGQKVGEFVLVERLGEGGFGEVWKATHQSDLARPVALKIATRRESVSAFRREEVVRLAVEHPFIVPIHTVNVDADPPYLVMDYVEGPSLRALLDQKKRLAPEEAVKILSCVLEALGAAHGAGLVHRDVKPGNVLLRGGWYTMLADFGLSKVEKAAAASMQLSGHKSSISVERSIAGTYDYMAPEQRRGEEGDHRVDLYACGVLLYEMLTGEASPLRLPVREASRTLSDVVERAIESDPSRRFQDASAMIEALAGATHAQSPPPPPPEEGVVRRGITRVVGLVKRWVSPPPPAAPYWSVRREATLLSVFEGQGGAIRHASLQGDGSLFVTAGEDRQVRLWNLFTEKLLTSVESTGPDITALTVHKDGEAMATGDSEGAVTTWSFPRRRPSKVLKAVGPVRWLGFSPDGQWLVALARGVYAWDFPRGTPAVDGVLSPEPPTCASFSQDGRMLAVGTVNGVVRVWRIQDGRVLATLRLHQAAVRSVCFRPDGRALASADASGLVRITRVPEGRPLGPLMEHTGAVSRVVFSLDGRWLASGGVDGVARVWSGVDGRPVRTFPVGEGMIQSVLFTPDGRALVTLDDEGRLQFWSVLEGRRLFEVQAHEGQMTAGVFTRGGRRMVTAGEDGKVKVWFLHQGPTPDWGGRTSHLAFPDATLSVAGLGRVHAGDVLSLDVTVTNPGPTDLSQCWAELDAEEPWLAGLACAFGRVPAGESRTRRMWTLLPHDLPRTSAEGYLDLREGGDLISVRKSFSIDVEPLPRSDVVLRRDLWVGGKRTTAGADILRMPTGETMRLSACLESRMRDPIGRIRLALYLVEESDQTHREVSSAALAALGDGDETSGVVSFSPAEAGARGLCRLEMRVESEDGRVFALDRIEVLVE